MRILHSAAMALALFSLTPAHAKGLHFSCDPTPEARSRFKREMADFLVEKQIRPEWVVSTESDAELTYVLTPEMATTAPVNLVFDDRFELRDAKVELPTAEPGKTRFVLTASQKEILLALLHPGRSTSAPCSVPALASHIALRQNITAWAERLEWPWPDGTPAIWNTAYWAKGTPVTDVAQAIHDAFVHQEKYAIGCYTASKLVIAQGVLDYYGRVAPSPEIKQIITECLWSNNDPLVDLEPGKMWFFEADYKASENNTNGKLLSLLENVEPDNFVPGDWAYMLNPDPVSYERAGYEGSNAIYLGRGRFDDYYNDRNHGYTYLEKLDEVFQWRNGVFSRTHHLGRVQPLTVSEVKKLGQDPEHGGLVLPYRAVPYFFNEPAYAQYCQSRQLLPQAKSEKDS